MLYFISYAYGTNYYSNPSAAGTTAAPAIPAYGTASAYGTSYPPAPASTDAYSSYSTTQQSYGNL